MITGIFFILMGLLILIYPQILVAMISGMLILIGLIIISISMRFRRARRHAQSPFMDWIIRY